MTELRAEPTATDRWSPELLAGFRSGERDALREVYRLHVEEVSVVLRRGFVFESRGTPYRFNGFDSAFEFQDALHETFRRAFEPRSRNAYDGIRPYGPYLRTIARNVVLKGFRKREVLFSPEGETAPGALPAEASGLADALDPEKVVHASQVKDLVAAFLSSLPQDQRQVVALRFEQGMSQRDAAETMGWGRQRIRTVELKIRRRLLSHLRRSGETSLVQGAVCLPLLAVLGPGLALGGQAIDDRAPFGGPRS